MRRYFATGLALLLPVVLTFLIAGFFLRILTRPFLGITEQLLNYIDGPHHILFVYPGILKLFSEITILLALFFFIVLVGFIGKNFLASYIFKFADRFLHSIPVVNKIYKTVQDVIHNVFDSSRPSFSQVVLVPFPDFKSKALGFITREGLNHELQNENQTLSVFVPGTPNPTIGFMLMFPKNKVVFTDLKVEEALKFIVSCGVIVDPNRGSQVDADLSRI